MRSVLRNSLLVVVFGAAASAQTLTEAAAAAAGGTVGGVAGKKVSEGVTSIFNKIDKQAAGAAGDANAAKAKAVPVTPKTAASKSALIEAGPGKPDVDAFEPPSAPKSGSAKSKPKPKTVAAATPARAGDPAIVPPAAWDDVPPPPPLPGQQRPAVAVKPAPRPAVARSVVVAPAPPPPPPPPPPVTLEDLQTVEAGMSRAQVLKIGQPSARITMFENGGLLEIFSYYTHDQQLGEVRLSDGTVSSVQWHP
jgi:hypothetical protein